MKKPHSALQKAIGLANPAGHPVLIITRVGLPLVPVASGGDLTAASAPAARPGLSRPLAEETTVTVVSGGSTPQVLATLQLPAIVLRTTGHFEGETTGESARGRCSFTIGEPRQCQPDAGPVTLPPLLTAVAAEFTHRLRQLPAGPGTLRDQTMNLRRPAFLADLLGPDAAAGHTYLTLVEEQAAANIVPLEPRQVTRAA